MRSNICFIVLAIAVLGACGVTPPAELDLQTPDGATLRTYVVGRGGDTSLVLHGGPAFGSRYLIPVFERLAAHRTFILYDQRGRGQSSVVTDSTKLTADQDLADLEAVRAHFRLERPALIGHGWGAGLAALYALHHPEHVARLVMIAPLYPRNGWLYYVAQTPLDTAAQARRRAALNAGVDQADPVAYCRGFWGFQLSPAVITDERVVRALAPTMCDGPATTLRGADQLGRHVLSSLGAWHWIEDLPKISAPVLVIQGSGRNQPAVNNALMEASLEWVKYLPNAQLKVVGQVHAFPWLDDDGGFREAVLRFLDLGVEPAGALRRLMGTPSTEERS